MEEINATLRNLRRQKDFEVTLRGIDAAYKKAMKRNYYQWLETLHQLRHEKQVCKTVQYFSETEWRQSRKSLLDKQRETQANMQYVRSKTSTNKRAQLNVMLPPHSHIDKSELELL